MWEKIIFVAHFLSEVLKIYYTLYQQVLKGLEYINTVKVKWYRYRPGVAQRVSRGIALLFHDHGTRRGLVVSSTPWPHFTSGKDLVPIVQEAGWAPRPVWMGGKSRLQRFWSWIVQPVVSCYTDWATQPTYKYFTWANSFQHIFRRLV